MSHIDAKLKTTTARDISVFIATPMYGGMCYGPYTSSMINLVHTFLNERITFAVGTKYNQSLITRARDSLAADFMDTDCTHMMFIDADIEFHAEDILTMVEANKDVICGIYPRKVIDWEQILQAAQEGVSSRELQTYSGSFPINTLDGTNIIDALKSDQKPIEVSTAGAGFMLIKREVLEGLADKVPQYLSNADDPSVGRYFKHYFDTSIDPESDSLLSEDYHFCKLVRENGFRVWVAPWARLSHIGTHPFRGRPVH